MKLSENARTTLRNAKVSQAAITRKFFTDGEWHGDACGCPDDRCIGHHHDADEKCQCLPAVLASMAPRVDYSRSAP